MSRVGKKPIEIPEGVEITIEEGKIVVRGPKGQLQISLGHGLDVVCQDKKIIIQIKKANKQVKSLWGTTRALLANMIRGVSQGYERKLVIEGIGYRASQEGEQLVLSVGFSHPVYIKAPDGIKFSIEKNIIIVSGVDKRLVGQIAAKIRAVKPPEPYKGKGIRYEGEQIRRKLGKKAVAAAG